MFDFDALSHAIARQTVLCVGDLMLDEFVYGEVSRISPEAPAPVIAVQRSETNVGGAGNVARNIASLGARCIFAGLIGDDEAGAIQNWTKALETQPEQTMYYVSLADEYTRLMFFDQAEQVLREGLSFAKEDDKHLFNMHALLGSLYENKGDFTRAVAEYEASKKSCDSNKCNDHKEAFFNLGSAYAELNPPRKNEAIQQLQSFWKITCKGALAAKYADQCSQSQEIVRRMGGSLQ